VSVAQRGADGNQARGDCLRKWAGVPGETHLGIAQDENEKAPTGGRGFFGFLMGGTYGWGGNTHLMQTAYHVLMQRGTAIHSLLK